MLNVNQEIDKALILAIQEWSKKILERSKRTDLCYAPKDTGNLINSGTKSDIAIGSIIIYSANYARDVEIGRPSGKSFGGIQRIYIPSYTRKDGIKVKGHWIEYKDKRLIKFKPKISKFVYGNEIARLFNKDPGQKGTFFLSRAIQDESPSFKSSLEKYLRNLERLIFN